MHLLRRIPCTCAGWLLLAVATATAAATPPSPAVPAAGSPAAAPEAAPRVETQVERALRELVAREQAVWARLGASPDDEATRQRSDKELRDLLAGYAQLVRDNPDFADASAAYGLLLTRTGNREAAEQALLHANKLNPRLPAVKNQLANFLTEDGRYQEALPYYLAAIDLAPDEPLYHYRLGTLLFEYRRFFIADGIYTRALLDEKIQAAFRRAAELSPETWSYAYRYAESFYDVARPDWETALGEWRKLADRAQPGLEHETVALHVARVLAALGRRDEARSQLAGVTDPRLAAARQTVIEMLGPSPAE